MFDLRKNRNALVICLGCLAALSFAVKVAGDEDKGDPCSGDWYGLVDFAVDDYVVAVNAHRLDGGRCVGVLQMPERDVVDAPLNEAQFDREKISFIVRFAGQAVPFVAVLSQDGKLISGQAKFGQLSAPFKLTRDATLIAHRAPFRTIESKDAIGIPSDRPAFGRMEHPEIQYVTFPSTDALRVLNEKLQSGATKLVFDERMGYLPSVLGELGITIDSQIVVYSKTSVQAQRINPKNPRALFFRDDVTVGYIHDAPFLEFVSLDPKQGVIFYTLDQKEASHPQLVRRNTCLSCHLSLNTMGVPGMLVRSVITDGAGRTYDQFGDHHPDHRTPIVNRWGGWYVTGSSGSIKHFGNALLRDPANVDDLIRPENLAVSSLQDRFDTSAYASPLSDIAALMVFDHQAHMTNLLVRMGWDARAALLQTKSADAKIVERLLAGDAEELVDYMLFVDEAPLTGKVETSSTFAKNFSSRGPNDRHGRSLRQLDLNTRLLRYPCSYMIYSDAFDALPGPAKEAIYRRIWQMLSGQLKEPKYARLSAEDRRAIREILIDTKQDLPRYFK